MPDLNWDKIWNSVKWPLVTFGFFYLLIDRVILMNLSFDSLKLLECAKIFSEGNGIKFLHVFYNDLSNITLQELRMWLPLAPTVMAFFYRITDSLLLSLQVTETISILIFIISWIIIIETLGNEFPSKAKLVFWFFWALVTCPPFYSTTSQLIGLSFYSLSLMFIVKELKNETKTIQNGFLAGLATGISIMAHYYYWPIIVSIPIALLVWSKFKSQKLIFLTKYYCFWSFLFLLIFVFVNYVRTSAVTGFMGFDTWWFKWTPKELMRFYPFFSATLGIDRYFGFGRNQIVYMNSHWILLISNGILFLIYLRFIWRRLEEYFGESGKSVKRNIDFIHLLGIILMAVVLTQLIYVATRYPLFLIDLSVGRFYSVLHPFVLIAFISLIFEKSKNDQKVRGWKMGRVITGLILIFASLYSFKRPMDIYKNNQQAKTNKEEQKIIRDNLNSFKDKIPTIYLFPDRGLYINLFKEIVNHQVPAISLRGRYENLITKSNVRILTSIPNKIDNIHQRRLKELANQNNPQVVSQNNWIKVVSFILPPGRYEYQNQFSPIAKKMDF